MAGDYSYAGLYEAKEFMKPFECKINVSVFVTPFERKQGRTEFVFCDVDACIVHEFLE